jgi:uncharacterized protein YerC
MYDTKMKKDTDSIALEAFDLARNNRQTEMILSLLTTKERITIGRRLLVAQKILEGKTRFEINNEIQISPNTFAQINRWLETELTDYTSAHTKPLQSKRNVSKYIKPFSYDHMKKRYPAHFLLFSLIEKLWSKE